MNVMYYLSAAMKTVGLFSFLIAAPLSGITSFILLHLQKNEKVSRIGSWYLFLIIPYLIFVILLTMILENHINIVWVYIIECFLWAIEPLPGLIVINAGKRDNSSVLIWAGWLAFVSAACSGFGKFLVHMGIFI